MIIDDNRNTFIPSSPSVAIDAGVGAFGEANNDALFLSSVLTCKDDNDDLYLLIFNIDVNVNEFTHPITTSNAINFIISFILIIEKQY